MSSRRCLLDCNIAMKLKREESLLLCYRFLVLLMRLPIVRNMWWHQHDGATDESMPGCRVHSFILAIVIRSSIHTATKETKFDLRFWMDILCSLFHVQTAFSLFCPLRGGFRHGFISNHKLQIGCLGRVRRIRACI